MNLNQIKNLYTYTGIMLLDNIIITTSPDYLKRKTLMFFNCLGKSEFIKYPKILYNNQKSEITKDIDFWKKYCDIWNVKKDDYELMNIINFLLDIYPIYVETKKNLTIKSFEKYIGNINSITKDDLSYLAHEKILEFIDNHTDFNNRYFKLLLLNSI